MPITGLQQRMRELGRIRTGVTVASKNGRMRPEKLETFRLTSRSRDLIEHAAEALGGVAQAWGDEWEVITPAATLEIMVPPGEPISQWYELWAAGGCLRRCDGETMILTDEPCLCPADPAERREQASANPATACKPTTRLNVMLTDLPDLGVWRLETHGYYAATELAGAAAILAYATSAGHPIPARLRLEPRDKKVPGKPVNHYVVPVIEIVDRRVVDLLPPRVPAAQLGAGHVERHEAAETELPDGSDFRATTTEPPAVTAPSGEAAATRPHASPPSSTPVLTGLTRDELTARIRAGQISMPYALATAKEMFPDIPEGVTLDPEQRLALWLRLERDLTEAR